MKQVCVGRHGGFVRFFPPHHAKIARAGDPAFLKIFTAEDAEDAEKSWKNSDSAPHFEGPGLKAQSSCPERGPKGPLFHGGVPACSPTTLMESVGVRIHPRDARTPRNRVIE